MNTWSEIIATSFQNAWVKVVGFLPNLIAAIVIFVIGLIVATLIDKLVRVIVKALHIDPLLEKLGVMNFFKRGGIEFNFGALLGWLVKWFLIIVFLIATAESLGLPQLTNFLNSVVAYLPNVIVAIIILLVGIVLSLIHI